MKVSLWPPRGTGLLLGSGLALVTACAPTASESRLDSGTKVGRNLASNEIQSFSIRLERGDFLRVHAMQHGVDFTLALRDSSGDSVARFDGDNGTQGPEWLLAPVAASGEYRLEVSAIAGEGSFELTAEILNSPTDADRALLAALDTLRRIDFHSPRAEWVDELRSLITLAEDLLPGLIRARIHFKLGRLLGDRGDLKDSQVEIRRALAGFERYGNAWEQAPTLNLLSNIQGRLGQLRDSEATLLRAAEVGATIDFPAVLAATWNNFGVLYSTLGRYSEALDAYRRAEALYEQLGDTSARAENLHNVGAQLLLLGRVDEGLQFLRRAVERRRELGWALGEARALCALGWALELNAERGEGHNSLVDASDAYNDAIELLEDGGAIVDLAQTLERRGELHRRQGRLKEARQDLERALRILGTDSGPMQEAWVRLGLGSVLRDAGRLEEASEHLRLAIHSFEMLAHPAGQMAAYIALARLQRAFHQRQQAAETLERAIGVVESLRQELRTPEFRRTFLSIRQEAYVELVDLWAEAAWTAALTSASQTQVRELAERAFWAAERGRARTLLDLLHAEPPDPTANGAPKVELRRVLDALEARRAVSDPSPAEPLPPHPGQHSRPDAHGLREALARARLAWERSRETQSSLPGRQVEPSGSSAILPLLDPHTSLLAYSLGETRSWAFLLQKQGLQVFPLAARRDLEAAAQRAHLLIPRWGIPGFQRAAEDAVDNLAALVLGPVGDALPEGRLVVVPEGALHLVSFGLLPTPAGRLLLDTRDVVHLPSASVLSHLRQRSESRKTARHLLAVVADPVFEPDDPRLRGAAAKGLVGRDSAGFLYLPRLPASGKEARQIVALAHELGGGGHTALYDSFAAHNGLLVQGELSEYRLLHFATHGLVDAADPRLAGLAFSNFHASGQYRDGYLPARALYELDLKADLVVLSACRTAMGQRIRGEGLVGLSHGFLVAGARHLVVSLWDADDDASAELMLRFYRQLFERGLDPAHALRHAQLELRQETIWKAPRYWAGFIALGDWVLWASNEPEG